MRLKTLRLSKLNNQLQCWSNLDLKSHMTQSSWMTYKSQTFLSTWVCIEICDGRCFTDLASMESPWTLSFNDWRATMPPWWSSKINMAISSVVSRLRSGYSARSSMELERTLSSHTRKQMSVKCGTLPEITACTSFAIGLASVSGVASMAVALLCTWATTCGVGVPWRPSASIMSCSARTRISNASIWRSGASSEWQKKEFQSKLV